MTFLNVPSLIVSGSREVPMIVLLSSPPSTRIFLKVAFLQCILLIVEL